MIRKFGVLFCCFSFQFFFFFFFALFLGVLCQQPIYVICCCICGFFVVSHPHLPWFEM